ncbi:hypothetical protein LG52_2791 [Geobacillus kaustophilus]|uniref:Uncharacterized protein n=1 Tax=Geobacillus kaustophilus TaxID=1462 RepID=A0A0D8BZT3_GEOKU|nr:hypothetical protein LG52_2791 [Geobacillus kaustophilus]
MCIGYTKVNFLMSMYIVNPIEICHMEETCRFGPQIPIAMIRIIGMVVDIRLAVLDLNDNRAVIQDAITVKIVIYAVT